MMGRLQELGSAHNGPRIESAQDVPSDELEEDEDDQPGHSRRVLLVDANAITRESLVHMMRSRAADIQVASMSDCYTPTAHVPDLILVNIHGATIDEPEIQRGIAELRWTFGASRPIAAIADRSEWQLAISAIHDHALRGYIPTSLSPRIAAAAVRLILAGGTFAPVGLTAGLPQTSDRYDPPPPADGQVPQDCRLTYRESEVLRLLQLGKPNKIIAFELAISESTVKVHVRNIMKKLHATNRTQVALLLRGATPAIVAIEPVL
jgi:DNA-binding NarL/FixJ family response regulator